MTTLMSRKWFAHGVVALAAQAAIAIPAALLGFGIWQALALGAAFSIGCYIGRERHTVEAATSRAEPLWSLRGNPSATLDVGLPAALTAAATAVAAAIEVLR